MKLWYEIWTSDVYWPPYVLIIVPAEGGFQVVDPKENNRISFFAPTYEEVKEYVTADEYVMASGRMDIVE